MPAAAHRLGSSSRLPNRANQALTSTPLDGARSRNRPSQYVESADLLTELASIQAGLELGDSG